MYSINNDWSPIKDFLEDKSSNLAIEEDLKVIVKQVKKFSNNKDFQKKINKLDHTIEYLIGVSHEGLYTNIENKNRTGGRRRRTRRRRASKKRITKRRG